MNDPSDAQKMEARLWSLVADARHALTDPHPDDVAAAIVERLVAEWSPADMATLHAAISEVLVRGYHWQLWGAAYLINGGCSDDGFHYFRGYLIGMGRDVWQAALADPDGIANQIDVDDELESCDIPAMASYAHFRATEQWPDGPSIRLPALGEGWDFDDPEEMARRYPRLWSRFGW